ncbi:hypothetical protein CCR75_008984 [Bremia lactucae]|uniref:Uncharacterized protein n=1 Tax=Bremia lactucae TaxID=4779 RepID=A0A976NXW8_BRELC|nr:hypothetical protein CCR75_008984 [Bremia lactucae]
MTATPDGKEKRVTTGVEQDVPSCVQSISRVCRSLNPRRASLLFSEGGSSAIEYGTSANQSERLSGNGPS